MDVRPLIVIEGATAQIVQPEHFAIETNLQDLLEHHPEIIWLGEVTESPPKLATIGREVVVPSGKIDLLMLGSDGVLTLVETKLRRNEEARRAVVAQVLEYGSYLASWTVDQIEEVTRRYLSAKGSPFEDFNGWLAAAFEEPSGADLSSRLASQLSAGSLRMVIAVDTIPDSLRSLAAFVNRHSTFELLILQVTSYPTGRDGHIVVPDLFDYAPRSRALAEQRSARTGMWTFAKETMLAAVRERDPSAITSLERLYDLALDRYELRPGQGKQPTFLVGVTSGGRWITLYKVEPHSDRVWFYQGGVDRAVGTGTATDFLPRLRRIFGPDLHIAPKGYWASTTIQQAGERIDDLQVLLDEVVSIARTPADERSAS